MPKVYGQFKEVQVLVKQLQQDNNQHHDAAARAQKVMQLTKEAKNLKKDNANATDESGEKNLLLARNNGAKRTSKKKPCLRKSQNNTFLLIAKSHPQL